MKRALLAIDPGLTTGFACYYMDANETFVSGEIKGFLEFCKMAEGLLTNGYVWSVVCESFTITEQTARKSRQYDALYIIGVVQFLCERLGIPFSVQSPADAKGFSSDTKLKSVGFYRRGLGHANDASRHGLLWLVKHKVIAPERLLSGAS